MIFYKIRFLKILFLRRFPATMHNAERSASHPHNRRPIEPLAATLPDDFDCQLVGAVHADASVLLGANQARDLGVADICHGGGLHQGARHASQVTRVPRHQLCDFDAFINPPLGQRTNRHFLHTPCLHQLFDEKVRETCRVAVPAPPRLTRRRRCARLTSSKILTLSP